MFFVCCSLDADGELLEKRLLEAYKTHFFEVVAVDRIFRELCEKKVIDETTERRIFDSHSDDEKRGHLFYHMRDYGTLDTLKVFCDVITSEEYNGIAAMQDLGREMKRALEQGWMCACMHVCVCMHVHIICECGWHVGVCVLCVMCVVCVHVCCVCACVLCVCCVCACVLCVCMCVLCVCMCVVCVHTCVVCVCMRVVCVHVCCVCACVCCVCACVVCVHVCCVCACVCVYMRVCIYECGWCVCGCV